MNKQPVTKKEAIVVLKEFIALILVNEEWYKSCVNVIELIILYGSVAHQTNRIDSDIDIALFMPLDYEHRFTKGEYFYNFEGYEINIVIKSTERLHAQIERGITVQDKHVFTDVEIIFAKDRTIRRKVKVLGD